MRGMALILTGVALAVAECAALGVWSMGGLPLQLGLSFVIYLALRKEVSLGSLVLSVVILPIDAFAGGPAGHYAVSCAVVFACIHLIRTQVQLDSGGAIFVLGVVCGLIQGLSMMAIGTISDATLRVSGAIGQSLLLSAVVAGFATFLLIKVFDGITARFGNQKGLRFA